MMGVLQGVVMEIEDTSLPLVKGKKAFVRVRGKRISMIGVGVIPTDSEEAAFKDVDVALFVGAMPRKEGMERKDLLTANVKIFKSQGTALDKFAKKTVKVNHCSVSRTFNRQRCVRSGARGRKPSQYQLLYPSSLCVIDPARELHLPDPA